MSSRGPFTDPDDMDASMASRLLEADRVCVLTGAGISAESGIPTFRGADGIWAKYDFRKLATPEGFRSDPNLVWEWYQLRQREIAKASPNRAHAVLAEMESSLKSFTLVTQNIDGMHRRAGNRRAVELHGSIWRMRCTRDGTVVDLDCPVVDIPPMCACGSIMRPDVVWFGEPLPQAEVDLASEAAGTCEVMLVVGTSAVVYPAAALPIIAKNAGALVVEVNAEPTDVTTYSDATILGSAGTLMPEIWRIMGYPERFMK